MSEPEIIIIKKKAKGHAAHGAAWKVAYADFVTAMMALFMVLWLVSQTDQKIKKAISDYFRTGVFSGAPSVLEGGMGVSDHGFVDTLSNPQVVDAFDNDASSKFLRDAVRRAIVRSGSTALADRVTITPGPQGTLIQIAEGREDLLFDLSSSDLKPPLVKLLAALGPELAKLGQPLEIHGHTDGRPFASSAGRNNWTLSFERAERARAELQKNGVPDALIGGMYAHAATQPVDKDPLSPTNRRLSIFARNPTMVAHSAKPSASARPAESAKAGESARPGASATPAESAKAAASAKPGEIEKPGEVGKPNEAKPGDKAEHGAPAH
ncbi:MAG TPA: flagellar motor protein MotB [Polyangiaceae bacterium]|nr:flagellar motor protein MotB [Polyangiaceae bacterium]